MIHKAQKILLASVLILSVSTVLGMEEKKPLTESITSDFVSSLKIFTSVLENASKIEDFPEKPEDLFHLKNTITETIIEKIEEDDQSFATLVTSMQTILFCANIIGAKLFELKPKSNAAKKEYERLAPEIGKLLVLNISSQKIINDKPEPRWEKK